MSEKTWVVYLLYCRDGTCYCGSTNDLERRLRQHNGLRPGGARYTAMRRPVTLAGCIAVQDRSAASRLEAAVKKMSHRAKLEIFTANANP